MDEIKKISLREAVNYVIKNPIALSGAGREYVGRADDGEAVSFVPTPMVIEEFKRVIGDKWNTKDMKGISQKIKVDLMDTKIGFKGLYLVAHGGLCPGRVRLFEMPKIITVNDLLELDLS